MHKHLFIINPSVVFILRRRLRSASAVVSVTACQQVQLLQRLLIIGHLWSLGEEARSHAADINAFGGTVKIREPWVKSGPRLERRQDGRRVNSGRRGYREKFVKEVLIVMNSAEEMLTVRRLHALQKTSSVQGGAENLREGWGQLTGRRDQLQRPAGTRRSI